MANLWVLNHLQARLSHRAQALARPESPGQGCRESLS